MRTSCKRMKRQKSGRTRISTSCDAIMIRRTCHALYPLPGGGLVVLGRPSLRLAAAEERGERVEVADVVSGPVLELRLEHLELERSKRYVRVSRGSRALACSTALKRFVYSVEV